MPVHRPYAVEADLTATQSSHLYAQPHTQAAHKRSIYSSDKPTPSCGTRSWVRLRTDNAPY